jgi:LysR family transcriptional regulator, glycine cleavage system transcriptional activator
MNDPLATVPLSAIRVFEAAARLLSFTRAAEELGMTQAAVSWQVKALERRLDQALFRRLPREVALTPAGERLSRAAGEAMSTLRAAVSDLTDAGEGVLSITTLQTFANQWLALRLGSFQLAHPKIAVRLETSNRALDLMRGEADVAISAGRGDWPGLEALRLFSLVLTVLCPPDVATRLGDPARAEALLDIPRIGRDEDWTAWFDAAGVHVPQGASGSQRLVADAQVVEVAAAISNGAAVIASPLMFAAELAGGRLVRPFPAQISFGGYWLVYPADRRRTKKIAAFREWLQGQVENDPAVRLYAA